MTASAYTLSAKVLICGASGQVGHALAELLEKTPGMEPVALSRRQLDITSAAAVQQQLERHL
ncbi:MAG: sugar nucleotide-binding protein, partial [Marinobacterium sp.]